MNLPSSSARPAAQGFSLIELMITVALLGISIVAAVPSLINLTRDSRLSSHADLLVDSLNSARLEAVRQRKDYLVCPSIVPDTAVACSVNVADWANGWIVIDSGVDVVKRIQVNQGITLNTAASAVTFNGTLGSSTAAAAFALCAPGRQQQWVNISLSGRIVKSLDAVVICP